jgi:hypothetical protein
MPHAAVFFANFNNTVKLRAARTLYLQLFESSQSNTRSSHTRPATVAMKLKRFFQNITIVDLFASKR